MGSEIVMNVKINDKQANWTTEDKTSDPTFDENKFLTNSLTVAFDEIFRWRKFFAVQYLNFHFLCWKWKSIVSFLRYGLWNFRCCIWKEKLASVYQSTLAWYGQVWCFCDKSPKNPWSSKQVSRVRLYASPPIAFDGPVYARVGVARWSRDCTWI